MNLPHGFRRLRLAEEHPAKTALINTEQRRLLSGHRGGGTLCLSALSTIRAVIAKELRPCNMAPCLWEMKKSNLRAGCPRPLGGPARGARHRKLSDNSLNGL